MSQDSLTLVGICNIPRTITPKVRMVFLFSFLFPVSMPQIAPYGRQETLLESTTQCAPAESTPPGTQAPMQTHNDCFPRASGNSNGYLSLRSSMIDLIF